MALLPVRPQGLDRTPLSDPLPHPSAIGTWSAPRTIASPAGLVAALATPMAAAKPSTPQERWVKEPEGFPGTETRESTGATANPTPTRTRTIAGADCTPNRGYTKPGPGRSWQACADDPAQAARLTCSDYGVTGPADPQHIATRRRHFDIVWCKVSR